MVLFVRIIKNYVLFVSVNRKIALYLQYEKRIGKVVDGYCKIHRDGTSAFVCIR